MVGNDAEIEVLLRIRDLASREIKQFEKQVDRTAGAAEKDFNRVDKSARRIPGGIKLAIGAAVAGYAAIAAARKTVGIGFGFVADASRAEETLSKFTTVFGEEATRVGNELDAYARAVGRATVDLQEFAAGLQDTFVPLGASRKAASDLSLAVVALATDVASFSNKMDADVIRDFTSALVGEAEPVRKYGININAAKTEAEAFALGLVGADGAISDLAKTTARASLIFKGTRDAQGDALKTTASWANTVKRLQSGIVELRTTAGAFVRDELLKIIDGLGGADTIVKSLAAGFAFAAQVTVSFARVMAEVAKTVVEFVRRAGGPGAIFGSIADSIIDVELALRKFVKKVPRFFDQVVLEFKKLQNTVLSITVSILNGLESLSFGKLDFTAEINASLGAIAELEPEILKLETAITTAKLNEKTIFTILEEGSATAKTAVKDLFTSLSEGGPVVNALDAAAGRFLATADGAAKKLQDLIDGVKKGQQDFKFKIDATEGFGRLKGLASSAFKDIQKDGEGIWDRMKPQWEAGSERLANVLYWKNNDYLPEFEGLGESATSVLGPLGAVGIALEQIALQSGPKLAEQASMFGQFLGDASDEAIASSETLGAGIREAFTQYTESLSDKELGFGAATQVFGVLEGGLDQFSQALANGEKDFSEFAQSLLKQLAAIAIKTLALKAIGGIFGGAGVAGGEGGGGGLLGALGFAKGGIGPGPLLASTALPVKAYANGGIATSPQVGIFGEGRSNEAFVPLPDGRRIPVEDRGGGGMTISLNVESIDPKRASDVILENMPQIQAQLAAAIQSGSDRKLVRAVGRG